MLRMKQAYHKTERDITRKISNLIPVKIEEYAYRLLRSDSTSLWWSSSRMGVTWRHNFTRGSTHSSPWRTLNSRLRIVFHASTLSQKLRLLCQSLATSGGICPKHETWSSSSLRLVCIVTSKVHEVREKCQVIISRRWQSNLTKRLQLLVSMNSLSFDRL